MYYSKDAVLLHFRALTLTSLDMSILGGWDIIFGAATKQYLQFLATAFHKVYCQKMILNCVGYIIIAVELSGAS